MNNKEKFAIDIAEIACNNNSFAIDKRTEKVCSCNYVRCDNCLFYDKNGCDTTRREWADSEYVKKPVISKKDRAFLDYLRENNKYIARDKNGNLFVYETKPRKAGMCWSMNGSLVCDSCLYLNRHFDVDFPMVKWNDSEPWKIDDLEKLEVVDKYE